MLGLSTAWYKDESAPLSETLRIASEKGFKFFELGISPNPKDIDKIEELKETQALVVLTIHNVFSLSRDDDYPNRGDGLSSLNKDLREETIEKTIATVQLAERLKARAVIIHSGKVDIEDAEGKQGRICAEIAKSGLTRNIANEVKKLHKERNEKAPIYLETVSESIRKILKSTSNVLLGLESRYFYHQMPSIDELEVLFNMIDSNRIFYWHDTGHCQKDELVGVCRHSDWLQRYSSRMLGIHLHDMIGCSDHKPPGAGAMDFEMIKKYLSPQTIKVLEINHIHMMEEILEGVNYLSRLGIE